MARAQALANFQAFSSAAANASSDSDRSRFRRIPRSTSASRSEAAVIHSKSAASASRFSSEAMSVLRTSSGAPASIDARSRSRRIERPNQLLGLLPPLRPRPVGLGDLEQFAVLPAPQRGVQNRQRVAASRDVGRQIEARAPVPPRPRTAAPPARAAPASTPDDAWPDTRSISSAGNAPS